LPFELARRKQAAIKSACIRETLTTPILLKVEAGSVRTIAGTLETVRTQVAQSDTRKIIESCWDRILIDRKNTVQILQRRFDRH